MKSIFILSLLAFICGIADAVEVVVDTSEAPELKKFGEKVKATLEDWYPKISKELRTPDFKEIQKIPIKFDAKYDGIAYASGGRIVGSAKYYKANQEGVGSMIHEMTHVIQGYKKCAGWFTEGYADFIRYYRYERADQRPSKPDRSQNYDKGYGVSAYFLNYLANRVKWDINSRVNAKCRDGTYNDNIWKELTGKDAQTLWNDMQNSK